MKILKGLKSFIKKHLKLLIILIIIIAAIAAVVLKLKSDREKAALAALTEGVNTATVQRGDITSNLTSSGNLEPKDTYTITSLVSGEILQADFEEGDQVEKDQVLYVIDSSDVERDYNTAKTDYDKAIKNLGGGTVTSTQSGYVQNITIQDGATIGGSGSVEIADIYNDSAMTLRLAFLNTDADALSVGQDIIVELSDTGENIPGRVEEKSDLIETINGGTMVKYVKIVVTNPGGLTTSDRATAYMGSITSVSDATFEPYESNKLRIELPSSVTISKVLVQEGQYVSNGTALFTITSDSLQEALDKAESSLEKAQDTLDNYTITAPISGQIITKSYKVGDKINNSGSTTNELATIYDLSELTFSMSIDELDINDVKVGQEVEVTADAIDDKTFKGHVSNVSLKGTTSNGVTTYPVEVTLDEDDGLLPGMNVDGEIILGEALDVLYIPSNALMRGNIVYVKDEDSSSSSTVKAQSSDKPEGNAPEGMGQDVATKSEADLTEGENQSEAGTAGGTASLGEAPAGFTAVQVETGLISNDYVEIVSGLTEGQEVYVKDSTESTMMFGMGGMGGGGMGGGGMGGGPGGGGGGPM